MVPAEYATPDFVAALQDWGNVLVGLGALGAIVALLFRFLVVGPLKRYIAQQTKPIQPGTNGGVSLVDLHDKVDLVRVEQEQLRRIQQQQGEDLAQLKQLFDRNKRVVDRRLERLSTRRQASGG